MSRFATAERVKERLGIPIDVLISRGEITAPVNGPLHPESAAALRSKRRTSYHPDHCETIIEMAIQGHSLAAFAGRIGVAHQTVCKWMRLYPEFGEACARAGAGRLWFWETRLIHVANTGGNGSQGQVAIFGVVNAARMCDNPGAIAWINKTEIEHSGSATLANVVERMMDKLDQIAKAQAGPRTITIEGEQAPVQAPADQPVDQPVDQADSLW
jgi:hypothetical protein